MMTLQCDTHVAKSLQWLRGKGELCDIIVVGGDGQQTWGHSCVLAAHSTVIASVLQGRLAAERDWSVMRPLIISIDDDVSGKDPDGENKVNVMEALVGLVYGEAVNVSILHLPIFIKYATLLGLSHQICSCLELSKVRGEMDKNVISLNTTTGMKSRKKQSRKPTISKDIEKIDMCDVKQVDQVLRKDVCEVRGSEGVTKRTVLNDVIKSEQVIEISVKDEAIGDQFDYNKLESYVLTNSDVEKIECGSSILELPLLCSEKDLEASTSTSWPLDQCQDKQLIFEQSLTTESLPPTATVLLESVRESSEEVVNDKLQSLCQTDTSIQENMNSGSLNTQAMTQDIMDLVTVEEESRFCNENQHPEQQDQSRYISESQHHEQQEQQQKQQKQRSFGKGLVCGACGATFQRCGDLIKHVQHSQHFTTQCPLCFLKVREAKDQRLHFAMHDHALPFFCMYCDLRFRTRAALTMHAPKHSTTRPFVCGECGRGFKWRHALQAHSYTHSKSSRLLCDECGYSTKYVTNFKAHLVGHSGRFLHCPHPGCNFLSKRKTHLNDHLATHSKTRVHQCEVCGHSFSHAKNMKRHMRLHAPASNFLDCTPHSKIPCSFRTTRPDKLRDHLVKKHNILQHHSSQGTKTKVTPASTPQFISDEEDFMQKTNLKTFTGLERFKTAASDFTKLVQEATTQDLSSLEKLDCKTDGGERLPSISVEDQPVFQEQVVNAHLVVHADVPSDHQGDFEALVSAPKFSELTGIQELDTHRNQADKQQCVEEIADSFPPGFLVEHDILLDKAEGTPEMAQSQQLQSDTCMEEFMKEADKLTIPVTSSLEGQEEFAAHIDPPPYPGFPSQDTSESVVLEVMAPSPPGASIIPPSTQPAPTLHLLDTSALDKKTEKQEQCMESLHILEFMLDNVTD